MFVLWWCGVGCGPKYRSGVVLVPWCCGGGVVLSGDHFRTDIFSSVPVSSCPPRDGWWCLSSTWKAMTGSGKTSATIFQVF